MVPHRLEELLEGHVRPKGFRAGPHHLLGRRVGVALELRLSQQTQDYALRTHDYTGVPIRRATAHIAHPRREIAGRHVRVGDVTDPGFVGGLALARLVFLEPAQLAGYVVDHLRESQGLEPRRGSRGEVSTEVVAID